MTSAQLEMGEGGVPQTLPPSPCRDSLTCPRQALPGLRVSFFSFFLLGLNFPAVAKAAQASTCPLSAASPSQPRVEQGAVIVPREGAWMGHREEVLCVCVCVTVANTQRSLAIRGRFRGVSGLGDKERKSGAESGSGSSRGRAASFVSRVSR